MLHAYAEAIPMSVLAWITDSPIEIVAALAVIAGMVNAAILTVIGYVVKRTMERTDRVPVIEERLELIEAHQRRNNESISNQLSDGLEKLDRRLDMLDSKMIGQVTGVQHTALESKVDRMFEVLSDLRVRVAEHGIKGEAI
jgi:hypothetical protein